MRSEDEIRKHISELEKLLFDSTYADDTKMAMLIELQTLKAVLQEDNQ